MQIWTWVTSPPINDANGPTNNNPPQNAITALNNNICHLIIDNKQPIPHNPFPEFLSNMKPQRSNTHEVVPYNNPEDDMRALDQSEKEYNRMISQHMTYHRTLMNDLMRMSSESGSGSGSSPRELLQQQINQTNQANVVRGMGTTIGNLNTTNQQLMQSASKFVDDTNANAKRVSRVNDVINQNVSKLNQVIDSYQELEAEAKEGFSDMGVRAATSGALTSGALTSGITPSMDAALEVSDTVKESHKYALVIFGIFATYALYRTIKQLTIANN